ncbi:MAG: 3-hydroxyacyl-CoA dehydrogenase NAD-binding domain-containing protein [Syntrophales bacterium]
MGRIFSLRKEGDAGIVTFDVTGEAMNTWTREALTECDALLDDIAGRSDIKGIVFISGKKNNFHAGANLRMIEKITDRDEVMRVLNEFHSIFNKISGLRILSVAAIDGHCLGGGLEFALACTARIAKESKTTLIGLPETNVGLYPGAGGTQRLPRLIGYPAVELILKGQVLPAAKAYELGIVDKLVPPGGDLLKESLAFLQGLLSGKIELKRPVRDFSQIDAVAAEARKGVLKATRGRELPAPMLAIRAIQEGIKLPLEQGLELEKKYFVDVALSKEAKGCIHTFFIKTLTDKAESMMTKGFKPKPLAKAAVLGFGTMGRGIVIDILRNTQIPVVVKDVPEALEPGKDFVRKILTSMAEKGKLRTPVEDLMKRLAAVSEYGEEFQDVDIVVEAVFEDIKVKAEVYRELSGAVAQDCIIASNTSSIPIDRMAGYVLRPERFGGTHFFSPVWMMQLVEVVRGEKTSRETVDNLLNFASSIRKRPIVCRDNPGFVVNAMLFPYILNVFKYLEAGNSIEKIDSALLQFGMPVGPFRLIDEFGIDLIPRVLSQLGIKTPDTVVNVVADGRYGLKKSGKGFFLKDGTVDPGVLPLISLKEKKEMSAEEIQEDVLTDMVKAGKDLLDRKIIDDPRMIDVGLIWGTGFPPDKGGPMKWADLIGLSEKLFGKKFY